MKSMHYFVKSGLFLTCLIGIMMVSGCKPRLLPSTNVPATRENKRVVEFLTQYKTAIEKRSLPTIMELVAKDYSDNMGSEDPALHVGYLALKEKLEQTLPRIQDIRLGMFVQHIGKIEGGKIEVVFYFNKQVLLDVPSGEKWVSLKEVSRMILRKRTDQSTYYYEILQGI